MNVRVQHSTNQSSVHDQSFTNHPRHLTQPEIVHKECNLERSLLNTLRTACATNSQLLIIEVEENALFSPTIEPIQFSLVKVFDFIHFKVRDTDACFEQGERNVV